jgi:CheY-like chemotaxis protein
MAIPTNARILIIEDEALISVMLQEMMQDLGLMIAGVALSTDEALALIEGPQWFDAASLDINLQGEISEAVVHALDARGIPFMVTTGYEARDLLPAFQGRPFLQKPFLADDFTAVLAQLWE